MKIALIACAWPPYAGGMANSAYRISQILSARHDVTEFTPHNLKAWLKRGHGAFLPQLLWKLKGFDYIYLHYPFFGTAEIVWFFKLLHPHGPKLIIHYHMDVVASSPLNQLLSWPSIILRQSLLKKADLIVSASLDYIKNSQIKKYYLAHPEKFQEIPFGLNLHQFKPKKLNQTADNKVEAYAQKIIHYVNDNFIKKNRARLLFVGGLDRAHYFKGLNKLFLALSGLTETDWRLTIVGEGDQAEHYQQLATNLQIDKKVKFAGRLDDLELIRRYQSADLLILPSINNNEAFGLVLIEALACGLPVIASDLPGVRDVFRNWQEGLLVAPGNSDDLRSKLKFILSREDLRQKMAQSARSLAEQKYDENKIKQQWSKIFI